MTWMRQGYCCQCGECCEGLSPWVQRSDLTDADDLMFRTPPVEGKCQLFEWHGDKAHCAGHGWHGYYLLGCNVWPNHPDNIAGKPSCTYTFTWVND
jgi:hypothetical protein